MDFGHRARVARAATGRDFRATPAAGGRGRDIDDGIVEGNRLNPRLVAIARLKARMSPVVVPAILFMAYAMVVRASMSIMISEPL